jgi:hypothetical protein
MCRYCPNFIRLCPEKLSTGQADRATLAAKKLKDGGRK